MMPLLRQIRTAVKSHMAALPVPYRTGDKEPSFQSLCDNHWHYPEGTRPFPVALDPFTCNRFEIAAFGKEAIDMVERTPDLAIVLMDIMMPEMDGYETMGVIRQNPAYRRLPIIALTAKAMKGDREKCLEAGASDYLAKPVNTEQLLSALRMWLHR